MILLKTLPQDKALRIANDVDLIHAEETLRNQISQAEVIELHFPQFNDGRAYSQAVCLRRRLCYQGRLRAIGEVLVDQLQQMQRCGFSEAVLREDQDETIAQQQLERFSDFYQGDALQIQPRFTRTPL